MKKTLLYKKGPGKLITCTACKWYCKIPPGGLGVCGVRAHLKDKLYLLVHSRPSAVNLDPVEKKPLFHFLPGSLIYSIGTLGCNFGCEFCQNWQLSQSPKLVRNQAIKESKSIKKTTAVVKDFVQSESIWLPPKKAVEQALAYGAKSIAFTYNEPTIFAEYAYDVMKLAKKHGLKGVFVSSGFETNETLDLLDDHIDAYNIDLKGASEEFYRNITHTKLKPVLETIKEIYKRGKWIEVTTLLIPGHNTSTKDLKFIAGFISSLSKDIPWHVSAFYPHYKMLDVPPTSLKILKKAYDIGKKVGLKYVYTGNIPNQDTESTYCSKCDHLLIKRQGYQVENVGLDLRSGKCKACGTKIAGVWRG